MVAMVVCLVTVLVDVNPVQSCQFEVPQAACEASRKPTAATARRPKRIMEAVELKDQPDRAEEVSSAGDGRSDDAGLL